MPTSQAVKASVVLPSRSRLKPQQLELLTLGRRPTRELPALVFDCKRASDISRLVKLARTMKLPYLLIYYTEDC